MRGLYGSLKGSWDIYTVGDVFNCNSGRHVNPYDSLIQSSMLLTSFELRFDLGQQAVKLFEVLIISLPEVDPSIEPHRNPSPSSSLNPDSLSKPCSERGEVPHR